MRRAVTVPHPSKPDVHLNTADCRRHSSAPTRRAAMASHYSHRTPPQDPRSDLSLASSSAAPRLQQLTEPRRTKPSSPTPTSHPNCLESHAACTTRDITGGCRGAEAWAARHFAGTKNTFPSEPGRSSPQHGPLSLPGPELCLRVGRARHQRQAQIKGALFEGGIV